MIVMDGPWGDWEAPSGGTSVTVGVLDGVHIGHRALLSRLDPSYVRTVLTFDPHPIEVLRPGTPPRLITTLSERIALLGAAGVSRVGVLDLHDVKEQQPRAFIQEVLVGTMRTRQLVVGEDFRFGKNRGGDVGLLRECGEDFGFTVEAMALIGDGDSPVSSSRIRELIAEGDVSGAAEMLGSRFTLTNSVVHGDKRGRQMGFPTANLEPPERKLIPSHGVYACFATVAGETHRAAVNVGVRPTFGGERLLLEAYLLDFEADIYGRDLTLEFVEFLRPELAFDTVEALVEQMRDDVETTGDILAKTHSRM